MVKCFEPKPLNLQLFILEFKTKSDLEEVVIFCQSTSASLSHSNRTPRRMTPPAVPHQKECPQGSSLVKSHGF